MQPKDLIGVHVSPSRIAEAARLMPVCQVFPANPRGWAVPSPESFTRLEQRIAAAAMVEVVVHLPYIINLASDNEQTAIRSRTVVQTYLEQLSLLPVRHVVLHTGSGSLQLLERALHGLDGYPVKLCLENDAGGGRRLGDVQTILRLRDAFPGLGFCFDTAHAWGRDDLTGSWAELICREAPDILHLNEPDPGVACGSFLDRHSTLFGEGELGLQRLAALARAGRGRPVIIEQEYDAAVASIGLLQDVLRDSAIE